MILVLLHGSSPRERNLVAVLQYSKPRLHCLLAISFLLSAPTILMAQSSLLGTASEFDVTRFAGIPSSEGSADAVGRAALFHDPVAIWGDSQNLYVCDYG